MSFACIENINVGLAVVRSNYISLPFSGECWHLASTISEFSILPGQSGQSNNLSSSSCCCSGGNIFLWSRVRLWGLQYHLLKSILTQLSETSKFFINTLKVRPVASPHLPEIIDQASGVTHSLLLSR
jgi:hypothetical protein